MAKKPATSTEIVESAPAPWGGNSQHDKNRITGADGIRALAALAVIGHHLFQKLNGPAQEQWLQNLHGVMVKGAIGVSVFFVLSGMLLSYPFWTAFYEKRPYPRIGHYIKRRAQRIVPGFYVALLVSYWLGSKYFDYASEAVDPVRRLVAGLTFTAGFHYQTFFTSEVDGPLWSISFEVVSYVLMPIVFVGLFMLRKRLDSVNIGRTYWIAAFVGILLLNHWVVQTFVTGEDGKGWQFGDIGGAKSWMPGYNPIGFFAHFAVGILVAGYIARRRVFHGGERSWKYDAYALLPIAGIALLVWWKRMPVEPQQEFSLDLQPYYFPFFAGMVGVLLAMLAYSKLLGRLFDNPFLAYTAKVSFGLYIWHYVVLFLVEREIFPRGGLGYGQVSDPVQFLVIALLVVGTSYGVAAISWHVVEQPVLNGSWVRWAKALWAKAGGARVTPRKDDARA